MKKLALTILALALTLGLGAACTTTAKPIPQSGSIPQIPATSPTATPAKATPTTAVKVSSCDVVREALLTGSPAQIAAALAQLQADKTADATAREYADYYLHRDAASAQMRSMDVDLIRMSCS